MSAKIPNEKTPLLPQSYSTYGFQPPETTLEELIQQYKERIENLEHRVFFTQNQESHDALRANERILENLQKGYYPLEGEPSEVFPPLDPEYPYYQAPDLEK